MTDPSSWRQLSHASSHSRIAATYSSKPPMTPVPTISPAALQGKTVFSLYCASCHAIVPDTVILGPSLAGIAPRAGERLPGVDAESYIRSSILAPAAGTMRIDGAIATERAKIIVPPHQRRIGAVFQDLALWSHMTVIQNVTEAPIHVLKLPKAEAIARAEALLAKAQEIAHLGGWYWNIQTDDCAWTDEAYRIFGWAPQAF